jgi:hypothetical protein
MFDSHEAPEKFQKESKAGRKKAKDKSKKVKGRRSRFNSSGSNILFSTRANNCSKLAIIIRKPDITSSEGARSYIRLPKNDSTCAKTSNQPAKTFSRLVRSFSYYATNYSDPAKSSSRVANHFGVRP